MENKFKFCPECGTDLKEQRYSFCPACGADLKEQEQKTIIREEKILVNEEEEKYKGNAGTILMYAGMFATLFIMPYIPIIAIIHDILNYTKFNKKKYEGFSWTKQVIKYIVFGTIYFSIVYYLLINDHNIIYLFCMFPTWFIYYVLLIHKEEAEDETK